MEQRNERRPEVHTLFFLLLYMFDYFYDAKQILKMLKLPKYLSSFWPPTGWLPLLRMAPSATLQLLSWAIRALHIRQTAVAGIACDHT